MKTTTRPFGLVLALGTIWSATPTVSAQPASAESPAVRPPAWVDGRLGVTKGLLVWLDASRQEAARAAYGKQPLLDNSLLDAWFDGSGNGFHVVQRGQVSQPRFFAAGDLCVIRFDGRDDWLGLDGLRRDLNEFSVFLVAAARSNLGDFRAFLATSALGQNDYQTGLNIDMSGESSGFFDHLNVEGRGFGGAVNLMHNRHPLGGFHTIEVHGRPGADGIRLLVDGQVEGRRKRAPGQLRMDNLTLGARYCSNTADPAFVQGFLDGDLAEVIFYDRLLTEKERQAVVQYLQGKYANLDRALKGTTGRRQMLLPVADPPPVQMLVPGFRVRRLPVDLPNINNIRYRSDGKLVALGYNGNIYLISDTDGDGLPDKVDTFWESHGQLRGPIGMALTPPGYAQGQGVFVANKGKLSLIVDTSGHGRADKEIVVAQGWREIPQAVDAVGVAMAADGSLYFGLGTADYTNAYQIDSAGKGHYSTASERGTILKVSPDFKKREIVCTGVRFTTGLALNRRGDLFATDQEGATWLPNGNPLDELLHIQPGRHYGFPPRHPKYLPSVIDEPSLFDYGPQHQSTCGLFFNQGTNGGPSFGPAAWRDNALIAGFSRGKLFRTQLVATEAGYVARNQLLACLNMLTVDNCVSPEGDLVVSCHSGQPDWGTGPDGKGGLFKISYTGKDDPQPVLAWPASPGEVHIAFDRPLDPALLHDLAAKTVIDYGLYVRPGDRFESLHPPYAAVARQLATPRFRLPILSAAVSRDRRTLILQTETGRDAVPYALSLPGLGRPAPAKGELPQAPAIDLGYDLTGVLAEWQPKIGGPTIKICLPHLDLTVSRELTAHSSEHDLFWALLNTAGTLTLRGNMNLWHMLRPGVQPGSVIDYSWPGEEVTLTVRSGQLLTSGGSRDEKNARDLKFRPEEGKLIPVEIALETGPMGVRLDVAYHTNEDSRPRALPLSRTLLPWAATPGEDAGSRPDRVSAELSGGNWERGRHVFFSEQALCSRCHQVRGEGGKIGPDLSNLTQRDFASVLKDIREPSAAINPDHVAYVVELKDGRSLVGVPRSDGGRLVVGDQSGKETVVAREQVAGMTVSPVSLMPEGIDKTLGPEKMRDLLTFLMTEPLQPARLERAGAPPPRSQAEVQEVLAALKPGSTPRRPLRIVLCAAPKDHGPGEHDYPLWQRRWTQLFDAADGVTVSPATGWPSPAQFKKADLIVMYSNNPAWSGDKAGELDEFLNRGGGLVYIHYAVDGRSAVEALAKRIGLASRGALSAFRHGPVLLTFPDRNHPITRGFKNVLFEDESYWKLAGNPSDVHVLAEGNEEGSARPLLWTREQARGRVFVSIPGHYTWTFDDPLFRILLLRGMAWAAHEDPTRFNALVTLGARMSR